MASMYIHGKSFMSRLFWLTPMMGGVLPAMKYILKSRGDPMAVGYINYKGHPLKFRNCDATALKEVLVDAEYGFLTDFLKSVPSPLIIDLGAHIGTFSFWVRQKCPDARVLMVEANPDSYEILINNIKDLFSDNHWKALNRAAWKNNDTLKLSTNGDSMGNHIGPEGDVQVAGITLQEVINEAQLMAPGIDLMKIDIEGSEEAFFENSYPLLEKVNRLVIELHPESCNADSVKDILIRRYNNISQLNGRTNSKPVLYCTN